jgi:hypothetical protein
VLFRKAGITEHPYSTYIKNQCSLRVCAPSDLHAEEKEVLHTFNISVLTEISGELQGPVAFHLEKLPGGL